VLLVAAGIGFSGNNTGADARMEIINSTDQDRQTERRYYGMSLTSLRSPDGQLIFSFRVNAGNPTWSVIYKGKTLVEDSRISLIFKETGEFGRNVSVVDPEYRTIDETYELVVGKTKTVRNICNEAVIPLAEQGSPYLKINLEVRAYDDGVAFRYEFPAQEGWDSLFLAEENTSFNLVGDPTVLALFLPHFHTSHEGLYSRLRFSEMKEDTLIDLPVLFDLQGTYMAITEAALVDYAGMYLVKEGDMLVSRLSPLPGQEDVCVKGTLPHRSPWRVLMISDRIGDLFESDILTSLNEPCKIKDTGWIKPGKATWPWWNGTVVEDPSITPGNNFETNKYYIDFCARHGIEYHSVVEHGGHEWYVNNGTGYQPGTDADVTCPVDGLDIQRVCDYARSQGVGTRLWVHWAALYPELEKAFTLYEKWGISGLMIDFMDRDDQEMVNIQNEILQKAAEHRLHIQFHGAYKPTGLHRTYPNELTREGTLNYEVNKWDNTITPAHDLNIIFSRLLAGPTDYHLGGFRAVPENRFEVHYEKPLMMGTRCHMLAMYVILESYLSLVCDYPEAYESQAGFEFIEQVPATWDETKVFGAEVSGYMVMARRKGDNWYAGAVTAETRDIAVSFGFLPEGIFSLETYTDIPGDPNVVKKGILNINAESTFSFHLENGGGMAMIIKPL
jgi:alpha-glucosidase